MSESSLSRLESRPPAPAHPPLESATNKTPASARFSVQFQAGVSVHRSIVLRERQNQACSLVNTSRPSPQIFAQCASFQLFDESKVNALATSLQYQRQAISLL